MSASTSPSRPAPTRRRRSYPSSSGSSDATVESGGWYGIIDGGEDADLPDGSDPRYPRNAPASRRRLHHRMAPCSTSDDQGVNDTNVAGFYLGTHAHSDHIANADDIIYKYRPTSPEYSDERITDDNSLWDNQYVWRSFS